MSFNSKWPKVASGDILGRILIEKNLSTTTVWPVSHSRAIEKGRGWEVLLNIRRFCRVKRWNILSYQFAFHCIHRGFLLINRIWLLHFIRNCQMGFYTPFSTKNKIKIKPTKRQNTSWDLSLMKSWIVRIFFSVIF